MKKSGYGLPVTEDGKVLSPFFIMRFASLNAHHGAYANTRTITSTALIECYVLRYAFPKNWKLLGAPGKGIKGINTEIAQRLIDILAPHGTIYITSERPLEPQFEQYRIRINPLDMHHVMAFASLYIGDSQTMAAEAGVLGVPFVRFNDFVGRIGYLRELEDTYHLGFGVHASPLSPFSVGQKLPKIDQQLLLEENQKNNKKIEESSDTCSISNNLDHMSAQEQALGQPSAQSCSIDSVAQTLSNDSYPDGTIISSTKKPKNISFTNAPQAKNDKNVIYRLDGTVQPSGVEALIETVEALVGMDAEERRRVFAERRERMLGEKIDCAKFLTWFIEEYPQSVSETKAADDAFWEQFK